MEKTNLCIHVFLTGKRKGEICNKFCRKPRESGKWYNHTPRNCIHGKSKTLCKECGGSQICVHDKRKSRCKDCGGVDICVHNKQKFQCMECGGNGICIHNTHRICCKICNFNGYISKILSTRISIALNRVDEKGGINRLGCTIEEFVNYIDMQLENQIIPDDRVKMDWDNYGDIWEFDHIIPILHGNFKNLTVETILERLYFENIQPLYKDLNKKKGNRIN